MWISISEVTHGFRERKLLYELYLPVTAPKHILSAALFVWIPSISGDNTPRRGKAHFQYSTYIYTYVRSVSDNNVYLYNYFIHYSYRFA